MSGYSDTEKNDKKKNVKPAFDYWRTRAIKRLEYSIRDLDEFIDFIKHSSKMTDDIKKDTEKIKSLIIRLSFKVK